MRSRAGESSKIRVLGSLKLHKNRIKSAFGCVIVLGSKFSKKLLNVCSKTAPTGNPNWNLSWPGAPHELLIFSLGSTWLPKWCPMAPKVAPRVPKGCQNEEKMPSKASKCGSKTSRKKRSSNESVSVREQGRGRGRSRRKGRGHATANRDIETNFYPSPNGGPSSKVYYIYIYYNTCISKDRKARQRSPV